MHSTVRFTEPEIPQPPHQAASGGAAVPLRLPKISASPDGADISAAAAVYSRHGYSPPRSPQDPSGLWKYPLPSKSFRVYMGPPFRQAAAAAAAAAGAGTASVPVSRGGGVGWGPPEAAESSPGQLQRSRTEPALSSRHGQPPLSTPFVPSRAQISLRRRQPQQQQLQHLLYREATTAAASYDEAERLRWTMSTQRHWQVDRKGQQRNQGPFSREFTVHVTAPSNWMRMKWGRKQLHQQDYRTAAAVQQQQQTGYMYTKQAFGQQPHQGF